MLDSVTVDRLRDVEQFLFYEARLADEHRYEEWERLWTDDALYWVPANGDDIDATIDLVTAFLDSEDGEHDYRL